MPITPANRPHERGAVLLLFALATVVLLLVTALAVDLGIAHVTMARLSKAVDAAALAGARNASGGAAKVISVANSIAAANYGSQAKTNATYGVAMDIPSTDVYRVSVNGSAQSPTLFARLMNRDKIDVLAKAEATRYPLDMSLVLDVSYSLQAENVFDDMQAASKNFVDNFDDLVDQVGIVAYSTTAWEAMPVRKNFRTTGKSIIDKLAAVMWTNIDDGLMLGKAQIDNAPKRDKAFKVMVLFTDGRPTAFSDNLRLDGPNQDCPADPWPVQSATDSDKDGIPDCYSGAIAGDGGGSSGSGGLFVRSNGNKVIGFKTAVATTTSGTSSQSSPRPLRLPGGKSVNSTNIESIGMVQAEAWANLARAAGYTIYCVGLGNPNARNPGDTPDLALLRRIANDKGITNPAQPIGEMMFSPSAADLDETFARVADRILTRLTQ